MSKFIEKTYTCNMFIICFFIYLGSLFNLENNNKIKLNCNKNENIKIIRGGILL